MLKQVIGQNEEHEHYKHLGVNPGTPEVYASPAPLLAIVVLLLLQI
jgi:hypothetical protein